MSIEQKLFRVKLFQLQSMLNADVLIKVLRSKILVFRAWPWYSTWTIQVQICLQVKSNTGISVNWYEPMS